MASKQEEMMGVSRSGRVRKKSSKLIDFESPEEADIRPKKSTTPRAAQPKTKFLNKTPTVPPLQIKLPKKNEDHIGYDDELSDNGSEEFQGTAEKELFEDESDSTQDSEFNNRFLKQQTQAKPNFKRPMASESEEESEEHLEDAVSESEGEDLNVVGTSAEVETKTQKKTPLYLLEKSKKKSAVKDEKVVGRQKAQRKDKGKSRLTAYMVWAKEKRPLITQKNPQMDFTAITKRLGEMWSEVSQAERMVWKRRAMRLANKAPGGMITTGVKPKPEPKHKPEPKPKPEAKVRVEARAIKRTSISPKRSPIRSPRSSTSPTKQRQRILNPDGFEDFSSSTELYTNSVLLSTSQPAARAGEMEPLDVASHLHLLGESLSVIGTRLKEHEGQIAVSGSLSVLLDSVLCALGPLLCLTRLNPETNGCPPETLTRILDNIAYIMPGL